MSGFEWRRFRRLCQPIIVFSTPIRAHGLFPYILIVFHISLGVGWWLGWGWGSFTTLEEGSPCSTLVSTCLVDSSTATTRSPHLNGATGPLVFCEWWLVFLLLSLLSFLRHSLCCKGDSIQEVLFFSIHKTIYKKEYEISLNKGLLWLIIRAWLIELETAQGFACV